MRSATSRYRSETTELRLRHRSGPVLAIAIAAASLATSQAAAQPPGVHLGTGANEVWVLQPRQPARSVVVFGHGWSTPFPSGFGAWIAHLRARGSIVIYPRYRVGANDAVGSALAAFESGVKAAFARLGRLRLPVVAVGKSFGGSAVFYYAAEARAWHVPAPVTILSIFPALPIGGLPQALLPAHTFVEFFVGDADTTAGSAGADAFWRWLASHPAAEKKYVIIHSRPGFVANHDSAQRTDRIAQEVFWAPLDRLIARAR